MKDERIIDLVNGELDGTISPSEHQELATHLEQDPSVKEYRDEMQTLSQLLAAVPFVDPPKTLKTRVMRAIAAQESPVRSASRRSWFEHILEPFTRRPAWAVTYAFAAGIIVGLAVISVVETAGLDTGVVQGTIVSVESPTVAKAHIATGTATAEVLVKRLDEELRVDVRLQSSGDVTVTLAPDGADSVTLESKAGPSSYSIVLPTTSTISVTLTEGEAFDTAVLTVEETGQE